MKTSTNSYPETNACVIATFTEDCRYAMLAKYKKNKLRSEIISALCKN